MAAVGVLLLAVAGSMGCTGDPPTISVSYGAGAQNVAGLPQQFMSGVFKTSPFASSWDKGKQAYRVQVQAQVNGGTGSHSVFLSTSGLSRPLEGLIQDKDTSTASGYIYISPGASVTVSITADGVGDSPDPRVATTSKTPVAPAAPQIQDPPQVQIDGIGKPLKDPCRPSLIARTKGEDSSYFGFWWTWIGGPVHNDDVPMVHRFTPRQEVEAIAQDDRPANFGRPIGTVLARVC